MVRSAPRMQSNPEGCWYCNSVSWLAQDETVPQKPGSHTPDTAAATGRAEHHPPPPPRSTPAAWLTCRRRQRQRRHRRRLRQGPLHALRVHMRAQHRVPHRALEDIRLRMSAKQVLTSGQMISWPQEESFSGVLHLQRVQQHQHSLKVRAPQFVSNTADLPRHGNRCNLAMFPPASQNHCQPCAGVGAR